MKKIVILCCLLLIGCTEHRDARPYFYVKSTDQGYIVAVDHEYGTVAVTKPYANPVDADKQARQLNQDMQDKRRSK